MQKSGKVQSWELGTRTEQEEGRRLCRFGERGGVSGLDWAGGEEGAGEASIVSQSSGPGDEGGEVDCF